MSNITERRCPLESEGIQLIETVPEKRLLGVRIKKQCEKVLFCDSARYGKIITPSYTGVFGDVYPAEVAKVLKCNHSGDFGRKCDFRMDLYNSEKFSKEEEKQRENAEKKIRILIKELDSLDFSNYEDILDWLNRFHNPSCYCEVVFDREKIISIFNKKGFNETMPNSDRSGGGESFAKYIISKELSNIKEGRGIYYFNWFSGWLKEWKSKFGKKAKRIIEENKRIEIKRKDSISLLIESLEELNYSCYEDSLDWFNSFFSYLPKDIYGSQGFYKNCISKVILKFKANGFGGVFKEYYLKGENEEEGGKSALDIIYLALFLIEMGKNTLFDDQFNEWKSKFGKSDI